MEQTKKDPVEDGEIVEFEDEGEDAETEVSYRDVLLSMAMEELEHGKVSVIAMLDALGFADIVHDARIAKQIEDDAEAELRAAEGDEDVQEEG